MAVGEGQQPRESTNHTLCLNKKTVCVLSKKSEDFRKERKNKQRPLHDQLVLEYII